MRYALKLAYKGTRYHGWQVQQNAHSVQAEINKALELILKEKIKSTGSGRTDTGVHAREQYLMFDSNIGLNSFEHLKALNAILPNDISAFGLYKIADSANLRFDAIEREYEYRICRRRDPFELETSALLFGDLDLQIMNQGAEYLLSQKDFASFEKSGAQTKTSICDIRKACWIENGHILSFEIAADRFLRNMVRAIVGTLVDLGKARISFDEYREIFRTGKRSDAGRSMPAEGLFLKRVKYPDNYFQEI